jgi:hypothetical protein
MVNKASMESDADSGLKLFKQSLNSHRPSPTVTQQQQAMKRQIELDLGSTFIENLDLLNETEEENELFDVEWKSSVESSDGEVDPLQFYKSHICETDIEEEPIFLESELIDAPLPEVTSSDLVPPTVPTPKSSDNGVVVSPGAMGPSQSFYKLKPLCGNLKHYTSETSATTNTTSSSWDSTRFREYQSEQWSERFEELKHFVQEHGHCQISHRDEGHDSLARWSKRQRYQYKLLLDGKPSTMTQERIDALHTVGFAFNAHESVWFQRLSELKEFRRRHGHCNVPSVYVSNQKLSTWVKCQRRQHKLLVGGKRSNMTWPRVASLEALEFVWEVRPHDEDH